MISLPGSATRLCEGITRREWLRAAGLTPLGLMLPDLLRLRNEGASAAAPGGPLSRRPARACIVVFLFGAPAHQDVWDLKPVAPREVRGEFQPIRTSVPGIHFGEHIPSVARQAHRLAVVRSVSHPDNTHTVAMHYMLTGYRHAQPNSNPRNKPTDFPTFGAVARYLRPGRP